MANVRRTGPLLMIVILMVCATTATGVLAGQRPKASPWPPGSGPDYEPRTDPGSPLYDPTYNPLEDPNHPLKDGKADPGDAWGTPRRGDGTPGVAAGTGNWPWRELYYDRTYQAELKVTNDCETPQRATIFVKSPYVSMPPSVLVPGKGERLVPVTITMPPTPPAPLRTGLPGEPGWGWVQPPSFIPAPGQVVPPFHQPYYADIDEEAVVIWHPWTAKCLPARESYHSTGHIHFNPPPPGSGPSGPERIAEVDPCDVWWNTEERPPNAKEDCTARMRELAAGFVAALQQEYGPDAAWAWLPGAARIAEMSIAELLEMKKTAESQKGESK
jgi:hypothetical protein